MPNLRSTLPALTRRQLFQVGSVGVSGYFLDSLARPPAVAAAE